MPNGDNRAQMITEREAAGLLGLSVGSMRRRRYEGRPVPGAHELGRTVRYARSEVEAYRDSCRIS